MFDFLLEKNSYHVSVFIEKNKRECQLMGEWVWNNMGRLFFEPFFYTV